MMYNTDVKPGDMCHLYKDEVMVRYPSFSRAYRSDDGTLTLVPSMVGPGEYDLHGHVTVIAVFKDQHSVYDTTCFPLYVFFHIDGRFGYVWSSATLKKINVD